MYLETHHWIWLTNHCPEHSFLEGAYNLLEFRHHHRSPALLTTQLSLIPKRWDCSWGSGNWIWCELDVERIFFGGSPWVWKDLDMIRRVNLETQEGAIFKETGFAQAMHLQRGQKKKSDQIKTVIRWAGASGYMTSLKLVSHHWIVWANIQQ